MATTHAARGAGQPDGDLDTPVIDPRVVRHDVVPVGALDDALDDDLDVELAGPPVDDPSDGVRRLAGWLVVAGALGLAAAFTLTVDKIRLLTDPAFQPSCNLSPIVNCGNVMRTDQAVVFGFPNSLIGVGAFAVLAAIGAALLAGARVRPWFWAGLEAGTLFGLVFVHWLAFQSMFRIGSLCPWCMVVWAVVIPTFVSVTAYTTRTGQFGTRLVPVGRWLRAHQVEVLLVWALVFVATAGVRFWDYWQTLV